jgi:hypothetical protein
MVIQQRVEVSEPFRRAPAQLWQPGEGETVERPEGLAAPPPLTPPSEADRYMTVDERVENTIGVVFATWPVVDEFGLRFPDQPEAAWFDVDDLQTAVDRLRSQAGDMLRPLRIGDTFWVRGFSVESPSDWEALRDITSQARAMAKGAVAVAALGEVRPPVDDVTLAAEDEYSGVAEPVTQMPGGPATARPTI